MPTSRWSTTSTAPSKCRRAITRSSASANTRRRRSAMSQTDLQRFTEACNYPGRLDEAAVEAHLTNYLRALGIERKIVRLRGGWDLREHPSLDRSINAILDDFVKRSASAHAAHAARAAHDARDAHDARAARAAHAARAARAARDAHHARAPTAASDAHAARAAHDAHDARAARAAHYARDARDASDAL